MGVAGRLGGITRSNGAMKAEYAYDYLGQREQKKVGTYSGGSWGRRVVRKYVRSGWLATELDGDENAVRRWLWGRVGSEAGADPFSGVRKLHDRHLFSPGTTTPPAPVGHLTRARFKAGA